MTANVIAYCSENEIHSFVLPPHFFHVFEPLDISVFAPPTRALAVETDSIAQLNLSCIPRTEWTQMYIRTREKVFASSNIISGGKLQAFNH